ncbi:hypothetical protein Vadar_004079 [Vaccinium darrowii]|uniref:Uncharacterized protein n=1 Tax=Vaccinium darrowii TaxID=229202 RepID=A0ACB7YBZ1_9ERIC|nr:hypothetical protein Vadar_004079 [Vaccinium darrowii]
MAGRGFDDDDVPLCFRRRPKKQRKTKHHHQGNNQLLKKMDGSPPFQISTTAEPQKYCPPLRKSLLLHLLTSKENMKQRATRNGDRDGGEVNEFNFVKGIEMERGGGRAQTEEDRRRQYSRNDAWFTWSPIPKKRRTAQEDEEKEDEEEEVEEEEEEANVTGSKNGDCGDGSISCTLTDADLLDCPICFYNLSIPVFQCRNGHLACSSCCAELGNKCPTCSSRIGKARCRAVEHILESLKVSCRNVKYGCTEMVTFCKKHEHEEMCMYGPCLCPIRDWNFIDSSKKLYLHFSTKHSESARSFRYGTHFAICLDLQQTHLILREEKEGTLFVLDNWAENLGNVVTLSCIAPSTSEPILYNIKATTGASSTKLLSHAEFVPGWVKLEHCTLTEFLVVPRGYVGLAGRLVLVLRINGFQLFLLPKQWVFTTEAHHGTYAIGSVKSEKRKPVKPGLLQAARIKTGSKGTTHFNSTPAALPNKHLTVSLSSSLPPTKKEIRRATAHRLTSNSIESTFAIRCR